MISTIIDNLVINTEIKVYFSHNLTVRDFAVDILLISIFLVVFLSSYAIYIHTSMTLHIGGKRITPLCGYVKKTSHLKWLFHRV